MIHRAISDHLKTLLEEFPAVAVLGPRQVGKTTLVRSIRQHNGNKTLYFDLEDDTDRARLHDPGFTFDQFRDYCIILDEIQRVPELFTQLRPAIDRFRKPGRFILTGSASPVLVKGVSESLAGRVAFTELTPVNILEAAASNISLQEHWYRGGFPSALTAPSESAFTRWAENFLRSYIERDLSQLFGVSLSEKVIRNFLYMLAAQNGGIWNAENYARALGVTGSTAKRYLDFLEGAFLMRSLQAWYVNTHKRLVKSPKVYFRDCGLLHTLNRVQSAETLALHLTVGGSWEGYAIEQISQLKPQHIDTFFYRTHQGAECDLLLVDGLKPVMAIEIKFSSNPALSKGFYVVLDDLKLDRGHVIIPEGAPSQMDVRVSCSSLVHFLTMILPSL